MAKKKNNNRPYNDRGYNNFNNRNNRKNTTGNNYRNNNRYNNKDSNKAFNNDDLEATTRIRIDEERINDSDSLDISFLEKRNSKRVNDNPKIKSNLLKEKKVKDKAIPFGLFKNLFYMLSFLCLVVLFVLMYINNNKTNNNLEKNSNSKVEKNPVVEKKIVDKNYLFIGDFNTENFDFEEFNLDYYYVKVSDKKYTTSDILGNMKRKVYDFNPSVVFIELGINDLNDDLSNEEIVSNLEEIVEKIKENRPYAKVYVESVYPINKDVDDYDDELLDKEIDNEDIIELNNKIKEMTKNEKVNYLDVFNELVEDGKLKENYTTDGVHLSEDGYKRILKIINDVLDDVDEK